MRPDPRSVPVSFGVAASRQAAAIAALHAAVAEHLTATHGRGHWSSAVTERGVRRSVQTARVVIARYNGAVVGTLTLAARRPWAIDPAYFTPVRRPLYLLGMAVAPRLQGKGIGRLLIQQATAHARSWPSDALRLDAYDGAAGAGAFYARCGFREVGRVAYRKAPLVYFELLL